MAAAEADRPQNEQDGNRIVSAPEGLLGLTLYGALKASAAVRPEKTALWYFGTKYTFAEVMKQVDRVARALYALGIRRGDSVTIVLPNCPQAIYALYAVNRIGAIANMMHPLSSEKEITDSINLSKSKVAISLDEVQSKFTRALDDGTLHYLIATSPVDCGSWMVRIGYRMQNLKDHFEFVLSAVGWSEFLALGEDVKGDIDADVGASDPAVILYSGGTTGLTKGVLQSNLAINQIVDQALHAFQFRESDAIMTLMPIFHGFGLAVSIHTPLCVGVRQALIPRFHPSNYSETLKRTKSTILVGIPSMFDVLLTNPVFRISDLSQLTHVVCGGDTLTAEKQNKVNEFLEAHKSSARISPGYGLAEAVACVCVDVQSSRPGSIGKAMKGVEIRILGEGMKELPPGEDGEICVSGPCVMMEYFGNPEETSKTLEKDAEGRIWLHTGDTGHKDEDGYIYFVQRKKRMIVTNGFCVYPSQIENVFDGHPRVAQSCVVGVPDRRKGQKIKLFIVPKGEYGEDELREELTAFASENVAKYALPYEIEFRESLPKTKLGKIAYRELEEEVLRSL